MPRSPISPGSFRVNRSRPQVERMLLIHMALRDERYPNCSTLAGEIEVSTKTVQRDITFMRDRMVLPIAFDSRKNGYYYTEAVESFPMVQMTEGEMVALYVAQKVLRQYRGTKFEKPLAAAFAKLTAALPDTITIPLDSLEDVISFRSTGVAEPELETFDQLQKAVTARREVTFTYKALYDQHRRARWVEPYHLLGASSGWYLIAFDRDREAFRIFALQRIRDVKQSDRTFERIENFDPNRLFKGAMGVFVGKDDHTIRVRFDAFAAQLVREREWHESQEIRELPNDELEISLTLSSFFEVERWILSWGPHARVIEPVELQERIIAKAEGVIAAYEDSDPSDEDALYLPLDLEIEEELVDYRFDPTFPKS